MATRFWIVGGEYRDDQFTALIPGTEIMVGPFTEEQKARNEWLRLTYAPGTDPAMTRYSIAAEAA
jgi:hypothetical protein